LTSDQGNRLQYLRTEEATARTYTVSTQNRKPAFWKRLNKGFIAGVEISVTEHYDREDNKQQVRDNKLTK
jgi:hypothetical protein